MAGLEFSYTFDSGNTANGLLRDAHDMVRALGADSTLGPGEGTPDGARVIGDPARDAALRLLEQMQANVAELAEVAPELVPLAIDPLVAGEALSPAIAGLAADHQFYWLRIPYTLQPRADHRFDRLEIAIEVNPGAGALQRPRILSALPTREFVTLASARTELRVGIDERLQFSVDAGEPAHAAAGAGGRLGFVAGPFNYRVRKAVIERGPLPSERVFWRISETELLSEAPPELIAVIAVPRDTAELRIAAALQAYASGAVLTMTLGRFLAYLGSKLRQFFASGAPVQSTRVWDLTPRLGRRT
ncbi:MAG TPA: hypothetical protein VHW23_30475 [Kofleriaceae bacterium]|jgi:hypothetical protein|nr:hypothetical protein [Kofleriaceae bacterium]